MLYVDDLNLMDTYCTADQQQKAIEVCNKCNELEFLEIATRMYHPLIDHEIYTTMAGEIADKYRNYVYYLNRLTFKTYELATDMLHSCGYEKEHKTSQCVFLYDFAKGIIPPDFRLICDYFFYKHIRTPEFSTFRVIASLAYLILNNNPFLSPNACALDYIMSLIIHK
jgi:hypothetical protein